MQKIKKMNSPNFYRISHRTQNIRHHCLSLFSSGELWTFHVSRNLSGVTVNFRGRLDIVCLSHLMMRKKGLQCANRKRGKLWRFSKL